MHRSRSLFGNVGRRRAGPAQQRFVVLVFCGRYDRSGRPSRRLQSLPRPARHVQRQSQRHPRRHATGDGPSRPRHRQANREYDVSRGPSSLGKKTHFLLGRTSDGYFQTKVGHSKRPASAHMMSFQPGSNLAMTSINQSNRMTRPNVFFFSGPSNWNLTKKDQFELEGYASFSPTRLHSGERTLAPNDHLPVFFSLRFLPWTRLIWLSFFPRLSFTSSSSSSSSFFLTFCCSETFQCLVPHSPRIHFIIFQTAYTSYVMASSRKEGRNIYTFSSSPLAREIEFVDYYVGKIVLLQFCVARAVK